MGLLREGGVPQTFEAVRGAVEMALRQQAWVTALRQCLQLLAGEGVTIARSDVHYVVTEYGIAYLFGKSIRQRATALIELAHPKFRPELFAQAQALGYLPPEQTLQNLPAGKVYQLLRVRVDPALGLRARVPTCWAPDPPPTTASSWALSTARIFTMPLRREIS